MSRRVVGRAGAAALVIAATLAVAATPAGAVVTFGSGLRAPTTGYYDSCAAACTTAQVDLPGSRVTSPVTGTVKKFRLRTAAGSDPQTIRFRVLRSADGVKFTGVATSAPVALPTTAATTEFPVSMPIEAGDIIGVDLPAGGRRANIIATNGSAFQAGFFPALGDGAAARASGNPRGSRPVRFDLLLQADVEISPSQTPKSCTNANTLVATCADASGVPSVCGPGTQLPQCNLPLDPPTACSGAGTGFPTCQLPGNSTMACGSLGTGLSVCALPPPPILNVCGSAGTGVPACQGANNPIQVCGPVSLGFPACAFPTTIKANAPLDPQAAAGGSLDATLGCPSAATGAGGECAASVDILSLVAAKRASLQSMARGLSDAYRKSSTRRTEWWTDEVIKGAANLNGDVFVSRADFIIDLYLGAWFATPDASGVPQFTPLEDPPWEVSIWSELTAADPRRQIHYFYTGPDDLWNNEFTQRAGRTMAAAIFDAHNELAAIQAAEKSKAKATSAAGVLATTAATGRRSVVQRRVKLRRGKKTRLRLKLSRAQIRALVKQAQPGATLIPVRVIVSFKTKGRPIARLVDIPVRIKR